ncbi:MAG TPA: RHS repeat-associated core domain-containing protein, partial [Candidatus Polarisedimenticolia bacterium]|nr:RHS repeat-associated core domain-containing protein [Candidatus Polarisedimenticolia bacterium]
TIPLAQRARERGRGIAVREPSPKGQTVESTYDKAGNRTELWRDGDLATEYAYNVRNEIVTATTGATIVRYVHDENGNRTVKGHDSDNDGVILQADVLADYEYDSANRLVRVYTDGDMTADFEAAYDYRTRRVTKKEGGDEVTFRYDGGVSFDEWKNGAKTVEFVRGSGMGGGIGSILYSDRQVDDGQGGTVTEREYFVYSPAVGHTVATLTENTAVKSTNLFEAFGNIVAIDNGTWVKSDGPTTGSSDNNRLANTKERDRSIGLDNHGMRYYDPEIGRYTTRDPIGYASGVMNVFGYVRNNPINLFDPLGLSDEDRRKIRERGRTVLAKEKDEERERRSEYEAEHRALRKAGNPEGADALERQERSRRAEWEKDYTALAKAYRQAGANRSLWGRKISDHKVDFSKLSDEDQKKMEKAIELANGFLGSGKSSAFPSSWRYETRDGELWLNRGGTKVLGESLPDMEIQVIARNLLSGYSAQEQYFGFTTPLTGKGDANAQNLFVRTDASSAAETLLHETHHTVKQLGELGRVRYWGRYSAEYTFQGYKNVSFETGSARDYPWGAGAYTTTHEYNAWRTGNR